MRIYTRTGDQGETGLIGGARVPKDDLRVEAYGAVDELNAALGWVRSLPGLSPEIDGALAGIQGELLHLGADLAAPPGREVVPRLGPDRVTALERTIDAFEAGLEKLTRFILPGGSQAAAALHLARTVCRRAERRCVALSRSDAAAASQAVVYLNRLSDLLFVLARAANQAAGVPDVPWEPRAGER